MRLSSAIDQRYPAPLLAGKCPACSLNKTMIDYTVLYKDELSVDSDWPADVRWDIFVSAYTAAERVKAVYDKVSAADKHWLVFPEYGWGCPPG